MISRGL